MDLPETPSPSQSWFEKPGVVKWRRLLRATYKAGTQAYLAVNPSPLSVDRRTRIVQAGRRGLTSDNRAVGPRSRKKLERQEKNRIEIAAALGTLLREKPIRRIIIADLRDRSSRNNAGIYSAFVSGLPGAYCFWATTQLDELTGLMQAQVDDELSRRRKPREILRRWADGVSRYIMEEPHGRLSMISFLVYEIDSIGASLIDDLDHMDHLEKERQTKVIQEFADLAALCHRSGARLIHQLEAVFAAGGSEFVGSGQAAVSVWRNDDDVRWNLAVSFWQTILTNILAVGLIEAEREAANLRTFVFEAWYRGATRPRK